MRVGLFIEKFDPARGGRERSTDEMATLLAEAGCEVTIVCRSGVSDAGRLFRVRALGALPLGRWTQAMSFHRRCRRLIGSGAFDVTHATFPLVGADIYQLRSGVIEAARQAGSTPLKRLTWYADPVRPYLRHLERRVMTDRRTLLLPVSEKVARDIEQHYHRTDRVRTVFNGVTVPQDFDRRRPALRREIRRQWSLDDADIVLLCPAMNPKLKGVAFLLKAFTEVQREDGRLRLVLVGGDHGGCEQTPGVLHQGRVDDVFPLYAAADAVVLLSWYDACSRVVLEACSVGLPCITTAGNGAAEMLTDGAGIVIEAPDAHEQLAGALKTLTDEKARAAMARAATALAPRVSMRRHVGELLEIYKEIAESQP